MLEGRDLSVRYGGVRAVDGVSISVAPGELVALLGSNGAGKTSTLAALSGAVPHGGEVSVDGEPVSDPVVARRAGVVHVPQGRGLFRRLTVEQNLVLGAYGRPRGQVSDAVARVLARVPELIAWRSRRVSTLSGGEQALVAIARLLVGAPRYALLDELALGLAPSAVDRLYGEIAGLRGEGVGVVLVEQYAPRAVAAADRVLVLERGGVSYDGSPHGVGDAEELVQSYLKVGR